MDLSIKGSKVKDRRTCARATKTPLHCQLTVSVAACPRLKIHSACYNEIIVSDDGHGWQRLVAVPIWSKYGVGWSRYAPPFFVFSTIDAPSTGHWAEAVNNKKNLRCTEINFVLHKQENIKFTIHKFHTLFIKSS